MLCQKSLSQNTTSIWAIPATMIVLFILLPSISEAATTYYTDKGGKDTNTCKMAGSQGTAKLTISAGIACLAAGDTLIVGDGTYDEQILFNAIPNGISASNPTTIRAANPNRAVLLPTSPVVGLAVININRSFITTDGLVVDATNTISNGGYYIRNDISAPNYITIKNGTARNGTHMEGNPTSWPNGILLDKGTNYIIQNMDIYNFVEHGIYMPGSDGLIENNRIHDWFHQGVFSSYGIQFNGQVPYPSNNIFRNNIIYNWEYGMIVGEGDSNLVYNNILYNNLYDSIRIRYGATNSGVYYNTVYGNGSYGLLIDSSTAGTIAANNIIYRNGVDQPLVQAQASVSNNLIGIDPLFENAAAGDFHLGKTSRARGAGISVSIVSTDFDGNTRSGTWDMGALMYTDGGTRLSPPANLRVVGN